MKKELVSIVVPVYNCEEFIEQTIESVKGQTYKNWEMILINDCSTDNSKNIIEKYTCNNIILIDLKENFGVANARNIGIAKAKGKYIAFLDSDDLWKKDKLEKQLKYIEENNCDFCFTSYEFANRNGEGTGKIVKVPTDINYKEALKNTTIFTSTVIVNVETLGKEFIKMPDIKKGQDTATWWKILKSGVIGHGLDENLSLYRRSENTLSSNKIKAIKRTWNLYRNVEKISLLKSFYYFIFYIFNAVKRRI